jgi:transglutaminase superfamily protein
MNWTLTNSWTFIRRKALAASTLSPPDWGLLVQAWLLLLTVDLALRLLPFSRVRRLALPARRGSQPAPSPDQAALVARLHRLVKMASRNHLYPMRCLRQSLVLQWLLGRRGISADLRLGVRKAPGGPDGLDAHAWLECDGLPIGERAEVTARYIPLVVPEVHA